MQLAAQGHATGAPARMLYMLVMQQPCFCLACCCKTQCVVLTSTRTCCCVCQLEMTHRSCKLQCKHGHSLSPSVLLVTGQWVLHLQLLFAQDTVPSYGLHSSNCTVPNYAAVPQTCTAACQHVLSVLKYQLLRDSLCLLQTYVFIVTATSNDAT